MIDNNRNIILLDTDIGSDIDDALCLAYLLSQPLCELIGITTVTAEPQKRAMLADTICRSAGRNDIPIFSGAANPILVPQKQTECPQAEILSFVEHRDDFEPNAAIDFMRSMIHNRPGEITLLAIGPLTNVGLLFAIDPEIPLLLKQLIIMGGVFDVFAPNTPKREWNTLCDPHAAAIVYNAAAASHISISLDVTLRCRIDAEEARQKLQGNQMMDIIGKMAEVWLQRADKVVFHDPLAAAVIFEPDICRYQKGLCSVELCNPEEQGMTVWNPNSEEKPHRIAVDVDPKRFFDHYFSVIMS